MRILFICGSLEPFRDGVGDYMRRLAVETLKQGHTVTAIGFNERHLDITYTGTQHLEGIDLPVLRLSHKVSENDRFKQAKEVADNFKPQWVSFHFVPYSYHAKGLGVNLGRKFKSICEECHWQIFFHELWVGKDEKGSLKRKLLVRMQKSLIRKMLSIIQPEVIHTHLPVFRDKLKLIGFEALPLPLFSNTEEVKVDTIKDPKIFKAGFFSQAEATPAIIDFFTRVAAELLRVKKQLHVIFIGGNETRMRKIGVHFEEINNLTDISYTGFIDDKEVSVAIQNCDIGITPIPRHAIGKSSSMATVLGHRIPVATPNVDFEYDEKEIGFFSDDLINSIITRPELGEIKKAQQAAKNLGDKISLDVITSTFLNDLHNSANTPK